MLGGVDGATEVHVGKARVPTFTSRGEAELWARASQRARPKGRGLEAIKHVTSTTASHRDDIESCSILPPLFPKRGWHPTLTRTRRRGQVKGDCLLRSRKKHLEESSILILPLLLPLFPPNGTETCERWERANRRVSSSGFVLRKRVEFSKYRRSHYKLNLHVSLS